VVGAHFAAAAQPFCACGGLRAGLAASRRCGSAWLFIGDLGSVAGSNTWMYAQNSAVFCDGAPEG
jgi:hypothetical protein